MGAVIGALFGFLFFCLWIGLFVFAIYTWVTYYGSKKNEMKAYENMMGFPSDNSVTSYIRAFEKSYNYAARLINGVYAGKSMEDKMRQASGYKIIMESAAVSDDAKEKLKRAFIVKGVPIQ